ncbi:hypothetical protein ARALYDRAFT_917505 [Arabidopsis lyrata subsp. lyrata]|uniref:TF-B3 domain-containing protein n=1 Tax=Arabidopsis lyrata subsp. lyrata TaxID=81972 RepID=D7MS46_ARALL|nr:hypothetical protein ARALYDRAFT_917505 [Arabidopsis lyrata subsp. lyrata]
MSSENPNKILVSTTLCLSSCKNPKRKMNSDDDPKVSCRPSDYKLTKEERKIARMRNLSNEEKAEDEWYGISTELTLFKRSLDHQEGWRMYFVRRRGLRKGDKIGLFWDRFASRLHFRVHGAAT